MHDACLLSKCVMFLHTGVLGHEFVGEIVETEQGASLPVGQRVVGEINLACSDCPDCRAGGVVKRNHCRRRTVMGIVNRNGTFAEFLTLPVSNLLPLPDSVSNEEATFVEPLAAAFRIVEQNVIKSPDAVVGVIGDGKLGLLISLVLRQQPHSRLVAFGRHADKMALLPADVEKVLVDETTNETFRDQFDVVVEASGSPSGIMLAGDVARPLATIVLKTTCAAGRDDSFNTAPFVVKELVIVGSRCGNFPMAVGSLERKEIDVSRLLTRTYPLAEARAAIRHAGQKGVLKIQLLIGDTFT